VTRGYVDVVEMSASDYFEKIEKDKACPECEKHKRHVKLVEAEGKVMECPVCHYTHLARR
jgi:rubredoxin